MDRQIKSEPIPRRGTWETRDNRGGLSLRGIITKADALAAHLCLRPANLRQIVTVVLKSKPQATAIDG
jgi:hypothetical protein